MRLVICAAVVLCWHVLGVVWAGEPNSLTQEEKQAGFQLLFNGKNLDGWGPIDGPWKVQEGAMCFPEADSSHGPDFLAYQAKWLPADFELRFEWKEAPPGPPGLEGQFAIGTSLGETTGNEWTCGGPGLADSWRDTFYAATAGAFSAS